MPVVADAAFDKIDEIGFDHTAAGPPWCFPPARRAHPHLQGRPRRSYCRGAPEPTCGEDTVAFAEDLEPRPTIWFMLTASRACGCWRWRWKRRPRGLSGTRNPTSRISSWPDSWGSSTRSATALPVQWTQSCRSRCRGEDPHRGQQGRCAAGGGGGRCGCRDELFWATRSTGSATCGCVRWRSVECVRRAGSGAQGANRGGAARGWAHRRVPRGRRQRRRGSAGRRCGYRGGHRNRMWPSTPRI